MNRTPTTLKREEVPAFVRPFLAGAQVYDSSCSPMAKVWLLDQREGFYLKCAEKGTLAREAIDAAVDLGI